MDWAEGDSELMKISLFLIYIMFSFINVLVPATEKVEKEAQPRFLEDEGFYVGTRPHTSGWNQNRMEHRLLKEAESVSLTHLCLASHKRDLQTV